MIKVPSLPSTGQPIDTQYIYSIVESLITINSELASSGNSYINNNTISSTVKTANLKIAGKTFIGAGISDNTTLKVGDTKSGTVSFDTTSFTSTPVVVTSLVSTTSQTGAAQIILTISAVSTSGFNWNAYCTVAGKSNYNINYIAIGV